MSSTYWYILGLVATLGVAQGIPLPAQITNAFQGPCDWPYQYYTDAQITSSPMNISSTALTCSKQVAQFYFSVTDCGQPFEKFATVFNGDCFTQYTNLSTNTLDYFLQATDAMVLVACGSEGGWLATPVPQLQFEDGGFATSIGTMADILNDVDIALKVAKNILTLFGLDELVTAVNEFQEGVTGPLLESAKNLGNDLEEACGKVKNGDILLKIHDLLEYREKIAMIIEHMKNVFMSYSFYQCTFDQIFYSLVETNNLLIRPSTKCQAAPGADPVTPDPTHCAAGQVATGRHRKILAKATPQAASYNPYAAAAEGPIASLASSSSSSEAALSDYANSLQTGSSSSSSEAAAAPSTSSKLSKQQVEALVKADADWESDMLQDLGSEGGAATRKLMQNLITCTAQTKLTQLVGNLQVVAQTITDFRDLVAKAYTGPIAALANAIGQIKTQVNNFLEPFKPIKSIIDAVVNVLQNIQCPDFLSFLCDLGSILTDALNYVMQAIGLQPLNVYLQDLFNLLKPLLPNFVPDLSALNNLINNLIGDVELRIASLGTAVVQQFKPVLDLNYWLDPFVNVIIIPSPPVYLTRAVGTAGSISFSCAANSYPIVLKAVRHYAGCGSDLSAAMRFPCGSPSANPKQTSCTINYAALDTVCPAVATGYLTNSTIATKLLAELELQLFPGFDNLLAYVYCVDFNSPFGPLPYLTTAAAAFDVTYDAGWWHNETLPGSSGGSSGSFAVTRGTKVHSATPKLVVPDPYQAGAAPTSNAFSCGARQMLVTYIQPYASKANVTSPGPVDPCFTPWLSTTSDITAAFKSGIPAGTVWNATQMWSMLKYELCFFKHYSTFSSVSAPPWVTDPTPQTQGASPSSTSAIGGRKFVQGLVSPAYCPAYYTASQASTQGCSATSFPNPPTTYGTFSYIDAVYGPASMDSNYLCNGLSHGGSWLWSVVCQNKLGNLVGSFYAGFSPGTAADLAAMVAAHNSYCSATQTCSSNFCSFGGDVAQTTKSAWQTLCNSNYAWPAPGGVAAPGYVNNTVFTSPTAAQETTWRQGHRTLRQAVLTNYNTAGTTGSTFAATCASSTANQPLYKACYGKNNCTLASGGCIPQTVQFACVEPSYFANRRPLYELMLFGDAVPGSAGYTANVTCPSAGSQVAVLVSAGYGTSNNFGYTDITSSLYSACQGATCSFNVGSIANTQNQPTAGLVVDIKVRCTCGAGFESQPLSANSTVVKCNPCKIGRYRSVTMGTCQPCPLGQYTNTTGAALCTPCPAGTFGNITGGTNCTRCPAGTFSAAIGAGSSSTCVACALNSFAKLNGSTACINCAEGYYTASTGTAHNCTACAAGTKRAAADASCLSCPVGSWSSIGANSCKLAPAGSCQSTTSSSYYMPCEGGQYTATTGLTDCITCPTGTYTRKAYGSNTTASCVNYTTVDWISDSTAYAKSKGVTNLAFNLNLCVQYIKAKTNATNTTLIVRNLNNSLCNYGPYNVQFCNWDGGDCCSTTCNKAAATYTDPKTNATTILANACNPSFMMCYNTAASSGRRLLQDADSCKVYNPPSKTLPLTSKSCNPGDRKRLGNGRCDSDLNTAACNWDKGDCCPGSCVLNRKIIDSCSSSNLDCKDPGYAGKNRDTVPPRLLTSVGQIVLHSSTMPENGEKFRVPATDNDPCFPGYAEAVITLAPEEESCSFKDKTHYWQKVTVTATDASGNTATGVAIIDVVDSDPPFISNPIFQPANRSVQNEIGDITFGCKLGDVAACGKRKPAQRLAGVATIQVNSSAALNAYLAKDLTLDSTDSHPCHDDFAKVSKAVTGLQTAAQITTRLTGLRVPKAQRDAAVAFASGLISGGGSCRQRIWTVRDPGGNIDRAVEVVCSSA
ncbi:hypothetical protein OEZ86_007758 [Tetradesmus obliquus]|nr:hypothetical protein OEZ86_007758 [Tetradesmus obliquus]